LFAANRHTAISAVATFDEHFRLVEELHVKWPLQPQENKKEETARAIPSFLRI